MLELTPRGTPKFECDLIHEPNDASYSEENVNELLNGYDDTTPPIIRGDVANLDDGVFEYIISELDSMVAGQPQIEVPIETFSNKLSTRVENHNLDVSVFVTELTNHVTQSDDGDVEYSEEFQRIDDINTDKELILVPSSGVLDLGEAQFKTLLTHLDDIFEIGHLYPEPPSSYREPLQPNDVSTVYQWVWEWIIHTSGAEWYPMRDYQDNLLGLQVEGLNNRRYIHYKRESVRLEGTPPQISEPIPESDLFEREVNLRPTKGNTIEYEEQPSSCGNCVFWSVCMGGSPNHADGDVTTSRSKWCQVHFDLYKRIDARYESMVESLRRVTDLPIDYDTETLAIRRELDIKPAGSLRPSLIPDESRNKGYGRQSIKNDTPTTTPPVLDAAEDSWKESDIDPQSGDSSYAETMMRELTSDEMESELSDYASFDSLVSDIRRTLPATAYSLTNNMDTVTVDVSENDHILASGNTFEERVNNTYETYPDDFVEVDWVNKEISLETTVSRRQIELLNEIEGASKAFQEKVEKAAREYDIKNVTFDTEKESLHVDSAINETTQPNQSDGSNDPVAELQDKGIDIPDDVDTLYAEKLLNAFDEYPKEYITFNAESEEYHLDSANPSESFNQTTAGDDIQSELERDLDNSEVEVGEDGVIDIQSDDNE